MSDLLTEPERIRRVRYAADCAEHVLHLTGSARPQAEVAIASARAWVDDPTERHRQQVRQAAHATTYAADTATFVAAYWAAHAAEYAAYAAACAAYAANATFAAADADAEHAWQAERRRFYGLPED